MTIRAEMPITSLLRSTREFPSRDVHFYLALDQTVTSRLLSPKKCCHICCAPLMEYLSRGILCFSAPLGRLHARFLLCLNEGSPPKSGSKDLFKRYESRRVVAFGRVENGSCLLLGRDYMAPLRGRVFQEEYFEGKNWLDFNSRA